MTGAYSKAGIIIELLHCGCIAAVDPLNILLNAAIVRLQSHTTSSWTWHLVMSCIILALIQSQNEQAELPCHSFDEAKTGYGIHADGLFITKLLC